MGQTQTYSEQNYHHGVPGAIPAYLDGPNCNACDQLYRNQPSRCDRCAESFEKMLAIEAMFAKDPDETVPRLDADPAGGLLLRVV